MERFQFKTPARTWRERLMAFLPAAAWYAVIFAFSSQTGEESGQLSGALVDKSIGWMGAWGEVFLADWDAFLFLSFLVRKAAHMGIFFILTGLLAFALWRLGLDCRTNGAVSTVLCAVLAGLDELHQTFVPGRDGKLSDVLIDLGGGVCFLAVWWVLRTLWKRRRSRDTAPTRPREREGGGLS